MRLPERLQNRKFVEWNYLVKGLIEVWEIAFALHIEAKLEQKLEEDVDGFLTDWLAQLGNSRSSNTWLQVPQNYRGNDGYLEMLQMFFQCREQNTKPDAIRFLSQVHSYGYRSILDGLEATLQ